ncbi:MAG: NAD(P)H-hydrate dehydratase [Candidatus Zixiibacteriota bacterium]
MKLVTSAQMRAIDGRAIKDLGIPGLQLMENAGHGIAEWIKEILRDDVTAKRFAIVCGKGNNGGDGFVIARCLQGWRAAVEVFLVAEPDEIKGDALENLRKVREMGVAIYKIRDEGAKKICWVPTFAGMTGPGKSPFEACDMIIDAIFGTGFKGEVDARIAGVIDAINRSGVVTLAVDTPSGLNCDTGEAPNTAVCASYTATLALPKIGHYFYPGRTYCGQIRVIDIGIPTQALEGIDLRVNLTTARHVRSTIPDREATAHKGDAGKLFLVAGSEGLTGAVTLAAQAAVKSGCGLVTVGCPKGLNDILEIKLTEAMTKPLPELGKRRCLSVRALGDILLNIRASDAACLGPGVGRNHETIELFRRLIANLETPAILDADGLFPFSGKPELLKECKAEMALTPHAGEFSRLSGLSIETINQDRIGSALEFAKATNKVILLKGAPTIVASPDGTVYVNPTGNPGMATGGSGDVLSGLIGSLMASGVSAYGAAVCGAFVHGLAGDMAQQAVGTLGMSAGDIVNHLPKALKLLKS